MKEFDDFKVIANNLTDDEVKGLLKICRSDNRKTPHLVKLLKFCRENYGYSRNDAEIFIYGGLKTAAFKQLIYRSKERIFDYLLLSESISQSIYYDDRAKEVLSLRKQLIQFDLLCLRGLANVAKSLIIKIIQKARLYEYYDLLTVALYKKIRLSGSTSTLDQYQRQMKEIEVAEDCRVTFHKLEMYHKSLFIHINERMNETDYKDSIEKMYLESEADYIRTKSLTIMYYSLLFKAEYFELVENPNGSRKVWLELINLVSTNKYLNSAHGLSYAYFSLAKTEICLFKFDDSKISLRRGFQISKYFDPANFTTYYLRYLSGFYEANVKFLEDNIEVLNNYLYSGLIKHYFAATVRYYNACIKFLKEDYTSSYLLLNDVKELEQDKESYNIAIRILSIMNQIELEKYEIADNLIENLRKHHERVRKTLVVTKRDEKIIHILVTLSRHSYRFRRTYRVREEAFNLLTSLEKDYRWKILSPEMIVFHEWFEAKTRDEKYDHFKVMPAMKKKYSRLHKAFVSLEEDVEYTQ